MPRRISRGLAELNLNRKIRKKITNSSWFPYDTGNLKENATIPTRNGVLFDGNVAPYISYLERGTSPFIVTNGFGRGLVFINPGQGKHQYFISKKSMNVAVETIKRHYEEKGCIVNVERK